MKFREIVCLLNTDDVWITVDGDVENTVHIVGNTLEACKELGKYLKCTVERITPVNNGIEVDLVSN